MLYFFGKIICKIKECLGIDRKSNERLLNKNNYLVLKPDGSWTVTSEKNVIKQDFDNISYPQTRTPVRLPAPSFSPLYRKSNYDGSEDGIGEVMSPPDFFPKKQELSTKLDKCLDMGLITSCTHIITEKNTYILKIEIPSDNMEKTTSQIKLFTKAMEESYNFKTIQQERILSKISDSKYFLICFEYDPQSNLLNKDIQE